MHLRGFIAGLGLVFIAIGSVECKELHDLLTDAEFYRLFRTTRDNVPEYEVVPIMHNLHKRSTELTRVNFSAFGKSVEIHLDPVDGNLAGENTPVWLARAGSDGKIKYKKLRSTIVGETGRYSLRNSALASLLVDESKRNLPSFKGIIEDLSVDEWPARVEEVTEEWFKTHKYRRDVSSSDGTLIATGYHVITKTKKPSTNAGIAVNEKRVDEVFRSLNESDVFRNKRDANEVIHPSILVVTDYSDSSLSEEEDDSHRSMIRYQLAFWNAVDLRFRALEKPKIRLRIAGIVIGQGRSATPYIQNNMRGDVLQSQKAIEEQASYWGRLGSSNPDFDTKGYHVVMTMTDAKMYDEKRTVDILGLANLESLCNAQYYRVDPNNFPTNAITHDDGKFEGILTATHELGHVLGAHHDESTRGDCAKSLGYLMSPYPVPSGLMSKWSPCSKGLIKSFLKRGRHCADHPAEYHNAGNPIDRFAPGDAISAQLQCEKMGFSWTCDPTPRSCKFLQCYYEWYHAFTQDVLVCKDAKVGALDGTPCSKEHPAAMCVAGECRNGADILK